MDLVAAEFGVTRDRLISKDCTEAISDARQAVVKVAFDAGLEHKLIAPAFKRTRTFSNKAYAFASNKYDVIPEFRSKVDKVVAALPSGPMITAITPTLESIVNYRRLIWTLVADPNLGQVTVMVDDEFGLISSLFVVEEHRKQGVAKALMEAAMKLCEARPIYVDVCAFDNNGPNDEQLFGFYSKLGFHRVVNHPFSMKREP